MTIMEWRNGITINRIFQMMGRIYMSRQLELKNTATSQGKGYVYFADFALHVVIAWSTNQEAAAVPWHDICVCGVVQCKHI